MALARVADAREEAAIAVELQQEHPITGVLQLMAQVGIEKLWDAEQ